MPGVDFLQLNAADAPRGGVATWLTDALRAAIGDGRLTTGDRLPPSRGMAAGLGVSRGVVVEAYQRLVDEGLAVAEGARGTRVAAVPRQVPVAAPTTAEHRSDRVDLSPGLPDLSAFPRAAWLRCTRAALAEVPAAELGYGDPQGHPRLRAELARWLSRSRGVRAGAEDVVVVAGVAQALALTAQVLVDRGYRDIAVEDPGSQGTREELERWGLRTRPVPVDGDGMDVDALAGTGAGVALLTPAHQFPTGVVLSPERRRALIGWGRLDRFVVEDDYDAEHRYDRAPVPALQGLGPDRVVYAGSVSKTLAPGLRLGWVVAPATLCAALTRAKYMADLGNPVLDQLVFARFLASGEFERHLRRVRIRQRARRDAMLGALREHLPHAQVLGVAAGLHLLVTLPGSDDVALAAEADAAGVLVHPLSTHRITPGPPGLVLGYAAQAPDRIREAIARLGTAVGSASRSAGHRARRG
ncbi:MAG TPA: PLP-dependent aminotransferase family protein [Pseudonocardia sp.]|nr:PLP-dependent aminotransferase family protein [Pseudonocardia sp.]